MKTTRVVIVGAGLAGSLLTLRLKQVHPELDLTLLDGAPGAPNQPESRTWSFHGTDLTPDQMKWVQPLLRASWPRQSVIFPTFRKTQETSYHSMTSQSLRRALDSELSPDCRVRANAVEVTENAVTLTNGTTVTGDLIIDARGFDPAVGPSESGRTGWQKFVGLELECSRPHGVENPVIMNACVPQTDGYRFFYLLPWTKTRILIEDTRYSNHPELDEESIRNEIKIFAASHGWTDYRIIGNEKGVLPIPLDPIDGTLASVPVIGVRSGLFHPVTGYSLPWTVAVVDELTSLPEFTYTTVVTKLKALKVRLSKDQGFGLMLNRMLFLAAEPDKRVRIFEKFYRFSPTLISRFYSGRLTLLDKLSIMSGKPPVPVIRAVQSLVKGGVT